MPKRRRVPPLPSRIRRWRDVGAGEKVRFWIAWEPPQIEGGNEPWASWEEFLNDWAAVRAEALPLWHEKRAAMRAQAEAQVARYTAEVEAAAAGQRDVREELLAWAQEALDREKAKRLPFAEVVYQRVLAGKAPDGSDGDEPARRYGPIDFRP